MSRRSVGEVIVVLMATTALGGTAAFGVISPARHTVGITNITYTKAAVGSGAPRPLDTLIWYPAVPGTGTQEPLGWRDADVYPKQFPWIVFSHGSCGRPRESSYLTMALAGRGFIVVAPSHTGNTAADPDCVANFGDSLANRVPDVRFIIDSILAENANSSSRFAGRLRADDLGMMGLSFGGYTTLAAAQVEPRLRAAVALVPGGTAVLGPNDITIPMMIIGAENDLIVGFAESEAAYQRVAAPRFLVELLKGNHLAVTDSCFPLCIPGEIRQEVAHRIVTRNVLSFFRRYLLLGRTHGAGTIRPMPQSVLTADPG
jgi:predicted dienelactone hydrolase